MSRFLMAAAAAALLLVPAAVGAADGGSAAAGKSRVQGTVAAKFPQNQLIRVDSRRLAHIMRVSGSQARIKIGQRVELRGATLRQRGRGSRVLARGVVLTSSVPKSSTSAASGSSSADSDGKLEVKGTLSSLSPLTVTTSAGTATTCSVPTGVTLSGFAVGDVVRMRCDLRAGIWVLRALKQEDEDPAGRPPGDDDDSTDDDSTDDSVDDDSKDDDSDDDDSEDDDNSGPGGGDDD